MPYARSQIIHRVISKFLIQQAGLQRTEAATGAVTLIQRFGSAANLNIHLHCLVLDGVYRSTEGVPVFHAVRAPTAGELQALLGRIINRLMRLLTRKGYLIEEQGMTDLATPIRPRSDPCMRRPAPTALRLKHPSLDWTATSLLLRRLRRSGHGRGKKY